MTEQEKKKPATLKDKLKKLRDQQHQEVVQLEQRQQRLEAQRGIVTKSLAAAREELRRLDVALNEQPQSDLVPDFAVGADPS